MQTGSGLSQCDMGLNQQSVDLNVVTINSNETISRHHNMPTPQTGDIEIENTKQPWSFFISIVANKPELSGAFPAHYQNGKGTVCLVSLQCLWQPKTQKIQTCISTESKTENTHMHTRNKKKHKRRIHIMHIPNSRFPFEEVKSIQTLQNTNNKVARRAV